MTERGLNMGKVPSEMVPEGPQEEYDQWRSLRTHTAANLMTVYKEIFFAGFPSRVKITEAGVRTIDYSVVTFPQSFVYDFFNKHGVIEQFHYEEDRGMGSVTFADGDVAESCYLSAHLSLILPPVERTVEELSGTQEVSKASKANTLKPLLIFLEFAQALPFVNPGLLLREELRPGEISRHLLRSFPRIERKFSSVSAEHVVMEWVLPTKAEAPKKKTVRVSEAEKEEIDRDSGDDEVHSGAAAEESKTLQPVGPIFPGGDVGIPELKNSLWRLLQPPDITPNVKTRIRILDLWFEYYDQFQVRKTQPSPDRIKSPHWKFAQRPSIAQEFLSLDPSDPASSGQGFNVAHRLMHDGNFHQICTLLAYKIRLKNDPSYASFMRDIFTPSVEEAVKKHLQKRTYKADQQLMQLQNELLSSMRQDSSEEAFLKLSLPQAALNAMENAKYLRRVGAGEIDAKTGKELPAEQIKALHEKKKKNEIPSDDPFLVLTEFLNYIDQYAASGSAQSLLGICEDPKSFREQEGHMGYATLHDNSSVWRLLWEIFFYPLMVISAIIALVVTLNVMNVS